MKHDPTYQVFFKCGNCKKTREYSIFDNYSIKDVLKKKLFYCKNCGCELDKKTQVLDEEEDEEEFEGEVESPSFGIGSLVTVVILGVLGLAVFSTVKGSLNAGTYYNSSVFAIMDVVPVIIIVGLIIATLSTFMRR